MLTRDNRGVNVYLAYFGVPDGILGYSRRTNSHLNRAPPPIPEKHNSGNLRAGPPSDYLPDALLLAGLQDKLVNSRCLYLFPGPEHRVIFYIAPKLNHIIVVLAIGMTALAGSMNGNTI